MSRPDPLFDTLFRATARPPHHASAAPVRQLGTRARAGNAMNRTRAALLDGARQAVTASGTKITMAQVAAAAGVAKATLYNHFRTREAVLAALLSHEVGSLAAAQQDRPLPAALADTATTLSAHPLARALARIEPGTLAALARIDPAAEGWRAARDAVTAALADAGYAGTDTVLRWLASFLLSPAEPATVAEGVQVLLAGLPRLAARPDARSTGTEPSAQPTASVPLAAGWQAGHQ